MLMSKIETRIPFGGELSNGEVTLTIESADSGTDIWVKQGGDAMLIEASDWPIIRKAVDAIIAAHEMLTASQFQHPEAPE